MRYRNKPNFMWFLLLILIFILSACGGGEETPTPVVAVQGQAFVDSLQVVTLETFPVQVQATVGGNLSDSCTTLTGVNVQQQGMTFVLDVQTAFNDNGACAQVLVPFSETVPLNVQGLPAGTYTVTAGGVSQNFTLAVDNVPQQETETGGSSLTTSVNNATPGQSVTLTGQGFPADTPVEIGIGLANANYTILSGVQSGADGRFTTQVNIPANASPGEQWVFAAVVSGTPVFTNPITIVEEGSPPTPTETTGDGVNQSENGLFGRTNIYLIALEDGGQRGELVGCNDSVVPVAIDIELTRAPMRAAYNQLLSIKDQYYGESGLYNTLYQSDLTVAGINIVNREAVVSLAGTLTLAGECDVPRAIAQLTRVALQFSTVDRVTIFVNGQRLYGTYQPYGRG